MAEFDEQIPGTGGGDSDNPFRRRPRLAGLMADNPEDELSEHQVLANRPQNDVQPLADQVAATGQAKLSNRITDDMTNGKSGGAGAEPGRSTYTDPGKERLADLMKQQEQLNAPKPKVPLWRQIAKQAVPLAPVLAAALSRKAGAAVGAEKGYEEGVQRRHQLQDIENQNLREQRKTLQQEIEEENKGAEQRTFQHGEDQERNRVTEEGLNARANIAARSQEAQSERLSEAIKGRSDLQTQKGASADELEDRKQRNRMQLADSNHRAQAAIQKYKAEHPTEQKLPPQLAKTFGTYEQSQSRMDVMEKSYETMLRDPGNSNAMINLVTNHLGMTMGLQPGARITQSILNEAIRSGYIDERVEAHFGPDGILQGVVLSPRQGEQMVDLAKDRLMEDARAVTATEAYFGVSGHAPINPQVPGRSTGPGGAKAGAGDIGAANGPAKAPNNIPKPPRAPDPGMKWQYNSKTGQFREIPVVTK